jgi:tRNA/tmRNA/rRNA uracil-C5-methylase (TrmA/RlmC/RlmD family)
VRQGKRFDLVLCDPPRAGAKEVVDAMAKLAEHGIGYVACDPVTLARDLARLREHGWTLRSLRAYDMFPHTHHVELLASLTK